MSARRERPPAAAAAPGGKSDGSFADGPGPHAGSAPDAASGPPARPAWIRAVERLSDACGVVAAGMIFLAVLLTCQMIWVRYVSNESTVWQTEAVIYMMIGATLVGLPYVQRVRGHVSVDLLPNLLPPAGRRALGFLTLGLTITVIGAMLFHGYELWHLAFSRGWSSDTVWGPPLWIPYLALPVGLGLFLLQLVIDLAAVIIGVDDPFPSDPVEEVITEDAAVAEEAR